MVKLIRLLFSPLLSLFEKGDEDYHYRPSQRTILLVVGILFAGLSAAVAWFAREAPSGYLFPVIIFSAVAIVALVLAIAGSDRAVAKIWGSR